MVRGQGMVGVYRMSNRLNLRELCFGETTRLRNIRRFSPAPVLHPENVAEHTFYTAWYAMLIGMQLPGVNMGVLLEKALLHDIDEIMSGDIIRTFHRDGGPTERQIHKRALDMVDSLFKRLQPSKGLASRTVRLWDTAKNKKTLEGRIVAYADFLSVVSYVCQEVECGNVRILDHVSDIAAYGSSFWCAPEYDFIFEVVEGHDDLVGWLLKHIDKRKNLNALRP